MNPSWNAANYDAKYAFVFERGRELLGELAPRPGQRILDVGAGTAHLTQAIADAGASVVGIDASAEMIARARTNYPGLDLRVADARELDFRAEFDAAFSNATLHWIPEPERAAAAIARALKPGARFVAEMGGAGNCALVIRAFERAVVAEGGPPLAFGLYFPSIAEYARVLEDAGFEVRLMWLFDRPTPLDGGAAGLEHWLRMFATHLLRQLSEAQAAAAIRRAEEELRPLIFRGGTWVADYRRLRFEAVRAPG